MAWGKRAEASGAYACFISYRHSDNTEQSGEWASWLHQQLETYTVPPSLVGKLNRSGKKIPKRIYPVFRDETSAASSSNLTDELHEALKRAENLIVICTPSAAQSPWIDEELRFFKAHRGADHLFGIIVAGDPAAREGDPLDCQPKALRYKVDANGALTSEREHDLLFPDFRAPDGMHGVPDKAKYIARLRAGGASASAARAEAEAYADRVEMMKLKVIAGLLDVQLDDLLQRQQLYERSQRQSAEREALWTFYAFLTLPLLIGAMWAYSYYQQEVRSHALDASAPIVEFGQLIYLQLTVDNIGALFLVIGAVMAIVTVRIRKSLKIRHLLAIMLTFLLFGGGSWLAIDLIAPSIAGKAIALDQLAAQGRLEVDPCAPNVRRLFDINRDPSLPGPKVASACAAGEGGVTRGAVVNTWRTEVSLYKFLPLATVAFLPLLVLLVLRILGGFARALRFRRR